MGKHLQFKRNKNERELQEHPHTNKSTSCEMVKRCVDLLARSPKVRRVLPLLLCCYRSIITNVFPVVNRKFKRNFRNYNTFPLQSNKKHDTITISRAHVRILQRQYEVNAVNMAPKYYIVEAEALPEVFLKVAEAKRMQETGEAATVNEAARAVEISRSAFYKYRDSIAPFQNLMAGRIITFQLVLINKAGLLSAILSIFAASGANILTINQSIPTSGAAMVTISAETTDLVCSVEELLKEISAENRHGTAGIVAG